MNTGVCGHQRGHRVVIPDGVQPHPGLAIATPGLGVGGVFVDGLVLVPHKGQVKLGAYPEGGFRAFRPPCGRLAQGPVNHPIALPKGTQFNPPVAVLALVVLPQGLSPPLPQGAIEVLEAVLHPDALPRFNWPGADFQSHRLTRLGKRGVSGVRCHRFMARPACWSPHTALRSTGHMVCLAGQQEHEGLWLSYRMNAEQLA